MFIFNNLTANTTYKMYSSEKEGMCEAGCFFCGHSKKAIAAIFSPSVVDVATESACQSVHMFKIYYKPV